MLSRSSALNIYIYIHIISLTFHEYLITSFSITYLKAFTVVFVIIGVLITVLVISIVKRQTKGIV